MLLDLNNTLIAYIDSVIKAKWSEINIITAPIVAQPQETGAAIHLMLDKVIERTDMKGVGETVRRDETEQSYQQPAPVWLQCYYQLAAQVPEAAVGQSPFEQENCLQAQLKLLQPVLKQLLIAQDIGQSELQGCFSGENPQGEISNLTFTQLCYHSETQVPIIEFSLTAAVQLQEEITLPGPISEEDFIPDMAGL